MGRALGNLIYRIHTGDVHKLNGSLDWTACECEQIKGTKRFVIGGSIGTHGYTRALLPRLAENRFREVAARQGMDPPDLEIIAPNSNSAEVGARGAYWLSVPQSGREAVAALAVAAGAKGRLPLMPLLDIGGTKIQLLLAHVNADGHPTGSILRSQQFATPNRVNPAEFYARIAVLMDATLTAFDTPNFEVLPIWAVGQPGFFDGCGCIGPGTARDLGAGFPGSCPRKLLADGLYKVTGRRHDVYVGNDGRAAFHGTLELLRRMNAAAWRSLCGRKIVFLGLGTGLGAGYGEVDASGAVKLFDLHNAFDVAAVACWETLPESRYCAPGVLPSLPYQYGAVLCGKFFRRFLHGVDRRRLGEGKRPLMADYCGLEGALDAAVQKLLSSDDEQSPLNAALINTILADEITTAETEQRVQCLRPKLQRTLRETLQVIAKELAVTLVSNTRSRDSNYTAVIEEVARAKRRGRRVHFIGIGKSHSIGKNLAFIFSNLGIDSATCELTGANCENLTGLHEDDLVIMISNSGRAAELLRLLPHVQRKRCHTVALTGDPSSPLARHCHFVLNSHVDNNPSPVREAPTTSTTAALAAGTVIGIVVSYLFPYDQDKFFLDHPDLEYEVDFEGVNADPSFDPLTRIEDILRRFAGAISALEGDEAFATQLITLAERVLVSHYNGRTVFFTGAGASLRVAEKTASTLTSIGIDAQAVNSAQLPHGDFAHIRANDLLVLVSFSGETRHLSRILSSARTKGVQCALITAQEDSALARAIELRVIAGSEADDTRLAPVPDQKILSSFINLTVGDALAVLLAHVIGSNDRDFARDAHDGGAIGRRRHRFEQEFVTSLSADRIEHVVTSRIVRELTEDIGISVGREHLLSYLRRRSGGSPETLVFGMGAIGLAYLCPILHRAGRDVIFIERDPSRIEAMRKAGYEYALRPSCGSESVKIARLSVKSWENRDAILALSLRIDTAFTAIGVRQIQELQPLIIDIVKMRYAFWVEAPLNIVFCENFPIEAADPLARFRHEIRRQLNDPDIQVYFDEFIGLVPAIDEAVVPEIGADDLAHPIVVEPESPRLIIDSTAWKTIESGTYPRWPHIIFTSSFRPQHLRKLWCHNLAHAMIGYLGYARGYETVYDAISDPDIHAAVRRAMKSFGRELYRRWDSSSTGMPFEEYVDWRIEKYRDKSLNDTTARLCRDPLRKLAPGDRLLGPARYIHQHAELAMENPAADILLGIVAALYYAVDTGAVDTYVEQRERVLTHLGVDSSHFCRAEQAFKDFRLQKHRDADCVRPRALAVVTG